MGPGLLRMLNLIDTNPNDSVLVDRFLVLAADMPEHEKVEATLGLARTLLKNSPRKSIEVAWMVYNSSLRDMDSLSLIAEAFERLGKQGKADVIRSELKRITNNNLSPEVRNLARLTVEEHVTTTLAEKFSPLADIKPADEHPVALPIAMLSLESDSSIVMAAKAASDAAKADLNAQVSASANAGLKTTMLDLDLFEAGSPDKAQPSAGLPSVGGQDIKIQRVESVALPSDGLPAAIPAREPSKVTMDHKIKNNKPKSQAATRASLARSTPESSTMPLGLEDQLARIEELVTSENWDRLLNLLQTWFPTAGHPYLVGFFERHNLEKIDIRFAEYWLDILIGAQQERRAVRFMIHRLSEEPQLAWARMVLPKIHKITELMDLTPIVWRESEGVLALRDRISAQKPRLGCYWAA